MAYEYTKQARLAEENKNGRFSIWRWFWADPIKAFLILGLSFLSWLATYTGMLELIQANAMDGVVGVSVQVAIAFAVAMLMMMILYLLDALFSADTPRWLKPVFVIGYAFLTLISVGFGFGFYWKYLEARGEATRSASSAITQVQTALTTGQTRLENLNNTFAKLTEVSAEKAKIEREKGGTCGRSAPGDGPRRRLRDSDAQQFDFAGNFISGRVEQVNNDIKGLNSDIKKVLSGDKSTVDPKTGTRNRFLGNLSRKLGLTIARFNSLRSDPQLRQIKDQFDNRSRQTRFDAGNGRKFNCPDGQLQIALRGAVKAIEELPLIRKVEIKAVEGSEAIVEAFRRLAVTIMAIPTLKMPLGPDEIRKLRREAVNTAQNTTAVYKDSDAGLGQRDYIPLFVALFVDLCILLISLNRRVNRLHVIKSQIKDAEEGHFSQVLGKLEELSKADLRETGDYDTGKVLASSGLDLMNKYIYRRSGEYFAGVPLHDDPRSRNLANLFLSLESMGIVKPVDTWMNPFSKRAAHSDGWIKKTLMAQGNDDVELVDRFRPYKFKKDVLPNVMLDALIGTAEKVGVHETHWAREKKALNAMRRNRLEVLSLRLAEQDRLYRRHWDEQRQHRDEMKRRKMAMEMAQEKNPVNQAATLHTPPVNTHPAMSAPSVQQGRGSSSYGGMSVNGSGIPTANINTVPVRQPVMPQNPQAPEYRPVNPQHPVAPHGHGHPHPVANIPVAPQVQPHVASPQQPQVAADRSQQVQQKALQAQLDKLDQANKVQANNQASKTQAMGLGAQISGQPASQPIRPTVERTAEVATLKHEGVIGDIQVARADDTYHPPKPEQQMNGIASLETDTGLTASRNADGYGDTTATILEDMTDEIQDEKGDEIARMFAPKKNKKT